jgi:hypothetical protein
MPVLIEEEDDEIEFTTTGDDSVQLTGVSDSTGSDSVNVPTTEELERALTEAGTSDLFDPEGADAEAHLEPELPLGDEPGGHYNLRKRRQRGEASNDWKHKEYEYGYQITVKQALETFGDAASSSIHSELLNLLRKDVLEPLLWSSLTVQQLRTAIPSKMFLKEKFTSEGAFDKIKSRFVAGGHRQDRSVYEEDEMSSPTVSLAAVYMLASIGAGEGRDFMTMDIGSAYLNAVMEREVLMKIEPSLVQLLAEIDPRFAAMAGPDGAVVVRLRKALYGCVESAKLWFNNLTAKFKSLGFTANKKDPCIVNKTFNGKQLTVAIYVDDLLCSCEDSTALDWLAEQLTAEYKELVVHRGLVHSYLGQTFDFSEAGKVRVTMAGYVDDILDDLDVQHYAASPALSRLFEVAANSEQLVPVELQEFHSRVARLLYLAKRVRPDLLTAVIYLATRVKCATRDDEGKLNRVLGYLHSTREMGIVLECRSGIALFAYVDASYAVHPDFKSQTGGLITLGKGPIWAKSSRQKLNSKSSTEAELIAVSDSLSQVIWTRDFLIGQGYSVGPATLFQDNMSAIALANRGYSNSEKTRHVAIRFFFVTDRIEAGEIKIEHLPTGDMLADILTKPLQGELFRAMRRKLLNWEY